GGGHLVACIPRDEDDLPPFDPDSSHVAYDRWFDYRRYDRLGRTPLFNIGHGSAQTVLRSKAGRIVSDTLAPDADVEVRAVISNDGPCTAEPLLTLFAGRANEDGSRERRSLRGFAKCEIAPGESKELAARFPATDLALFDVASGEWRLEAGPHRVWASISGTPPSLLGEVRVRP
ncbi:MAG: fibronectin type III-like domain-contianing protein, partial [Myxococcota bacterium]